MGDQSKGKSADMDESSSEGSTYEELLEQKKASHSERSEVLRLTFEEMKRRSERQQEELHSLRETAGRTLRVTVILIGVLVTFSSEFRQVIASYGDQPVVWEVPNLIGHFLMAIAPLGLLLSPIFATLALKEGHFSESIDPWDMRDISNGKLISQRGDETMHPSEHVDDWYWYLIDKYSSTIDKNDEVLRDTASSLRLSHVAFVAGPVLFSLGVWVLAMYA